MDSSCATHYVESTCDVHDSLQCICGTKEPHQFTLSLSDDSDDDSSVWPTSKELELSASTKSLPNPQTRSFYVRPTMAKSALPVARVHIQMDAVYMIAYDIRGLRHRYPPAPGHPIIAWTLGYAVTKEDILCLPRIDWDKKQKSWIGTACTWTWTGIHRAENVLLVIKLGDPRTIELNDFLGLVKAPYHQRIVHLAAGRQYMYVRLMREMVVAFIERLGGTLETVADDFMDDVRRFTHLVKAGTTAHVSLHVFL
ncbi:hypothetical protein CALVIDRAFT_568045 [Calocera viscosa TUFC12733]|uniref:Uncharacterized protein n=1 Tax=Calocera viscosa (strain TUFC12733) TaxID=1330018 RepID=A0A167HKP7_CALVF|nr:hypothetical protein CALVIDRAFT_568045 [Calocera viscosa TUFC12733]